MHWRVSVWFFFQSVGYRKIVYIISDTSGNKSTDKTVETAPGDLTAYNKNE